MIEILAFLGMIAVFCGGWLLGIYLTRATEREEAPAMMWPKPRGYLVTRVDGANRAIEFVADGESADRLARYGTVRRTHKDLRTGDTEYILYISQLADWTSIVNSIVYGAPVVDGTMSIVQYHDGGGK